MKTEKLEPIFKKWCFVRYPKNSLEYSVYFLVDPRIVIAKHIIFLEETFIQESGITGMSKKINLENESYIPQIPGQITKYCETSRVIDS